jgi:hypothetical protein
VRAAALNHEVLDHSVKVQAVVEPVIYELEEVSCGLRAVLGVQSNHYLSSAGCHLDYSRHAVGSAHRHKSICVPP